MPCYVLALYGTPEDPAAFDAYYEANHVPIARALPGLRQFEVSSGRVLSPDGSVAHHQIALLQFDSLDAARQAFASPEGQATAGDLANFASGGVSIAMFDVKDMGVANPPQDDRASGGG